MTCEQCKYYLPQPHTVSDRDCNGYCIRYPEWFHKNLTTPKCGEWKDKKAPARRTVKKSQEYSDEFKAFYEAYPKKISPDTAWRAWSDILPEYYQLVTERATSFAQAVVSEAKDMQYVKHPATWLNAGDWKTKHEKKTDTKACIDCGAPYASGHKYTFERGKAVKGKYRCEQCRNKLKE